tara:strand:- start:170 stop:634 length:465 start_codon:yes stop_codon:yes gene_type:complete
MTKAELQKKLKDAKGRLETSRGRQRLSLKRNILNLENQVKNFVGTPAVKPSRQQSRTGRSNPSPYYSTAKKKEDIKKEKEKAPTSTEKAATKMEAVAKARPKIKQGGSNTTTAAQRKTAVESAGYKLKEKKKKSYGESAMGYNAYQNLNFKRRK